MSLPHFLFPVAASFRTAYVDDSTRLVSVFVISGKGLSKEWEELIRSDEIMTGFTGLKMMMFGISDLSNELLGLKFRKIAF